MKSLFPEMDAEIAADRLGERREAVQRAREFLAMNAGIERWVMGRLKEGPKVDANLMLEAIELSEIPQTSMRAGMNVLWTTYALWRVGKIRRKPFPNHPSGEKCFIYSLK